MDLFMLSMVLVRSMPLFSKRIYVFWLAFVVEGVGL